MSIRVASEGLWLYRRKPPSVRLLGSWVRQVMEAGGRGRVPIGSRRKASGASRPFGLWLRSPRRPSPEPVDYKPLDRASSYAFARGAPARFDYHLLGRTDRGCVRAYIREVCGFSPAQITRLIRPAGGDRRGGGPAGAEQRAAVRFLRVDTVHLGDQDGRKGVYVVNAADEVTQYEHVGACRASRSGSWRRCSKRCWPCSRSTRRRRGPLPPRAPVAVPQLHRPCLFATERVDAKGKVRRTYRQPDVATPLAKLESLPDAAAFLRWGASFKDLDRAAAAQSGLQAAKALKRARDELFRKVHAVPAAA